MKTFLVLTPDPFSRPTAIFWAEGDRLRSFVFEDGPAVRDGTWVLHQKLPSADWDETFMWLSERNTEAPVWDAYEVADEVLPRALLTSLRAGTSVPEI